MTQETNRWTAEIDTWLKTAGIAESRLGFLAASNGRAIDRIRDGTASVSTLEAVLTYIEKNPVERKKRG